MRLSERWRHFDHWFRHLTARRPVAVGAAQGLFVGLVVTFGAPYSMVFHLVSGAVYACLFGALYAYLWRPGGMHRRRYERWCARVEGEVPVPILADGEVAPGWYGDPARGGRIAYWTGQKWA